MVVHQEQTCISTCHATAAEGWVYAYAVAAPCMSTMYVHTYRQAVGDGEHATIWRDNPSPDLPETTTRSETEAETTGLATTSAIGISFVGRAVKFVRRPALDPSQDEEAGESRPGN